MFTDFDTPWRLVMVTVMPCRSAFTFVAAVVAASAFSMASLAACFTSTRSLVASLTSPARSSILFLKVFIGTWA